MILDYTRDTEKETFEQNPILQDAVIRRLTIIGEATKRLSEAFRLSHPEIPWKQIAGMRDVVVHNYDQVLMDKIWEVIQGDIPVLIKHVEPLIPPDESDMGHGEG